MATLIPSADPPRRPPDPLVLGAVGAVGLSSAMLLFWALGQALFAAAFGAIFAAIVAIVLLAAHFRRAGAAAPPEPDRALLRALVEDDGQAVALTDAAGHLVCANQSFADWFGGYAPPPDLALAGASARMLADAGRAAWRDGAATARAVRTARGGFDLSVTRAGTRDDHLVWRMRRGAALDLTAEARRLIGGPGGDRLGEAGVMIALVADGGRLIAANRVFAKRAIGRPDAELEGRALIGLLETDEDDGVRFAAEGERGGGLRLIQLPISADGEDGASLVILLDEGGSEEVDAAAAAAAVNLHGLLAMLPLGLALADRDGRFLFLNKAFRRAAALVDEDEPIYPSDLVVKEDKAAVADTVRRFALGQKAAGGQAIPGDLAIRLKHRPDEPVALTLAGATGLGEATILLSLKDNSEENRLKRQVAQATKMQAVGQLAGGVAHDFNNILTAIIGHCDLVLLRHTPGDSDYDDIQQIRLNSNRAAGLTRQLLAFSRQQTLRPQILQLPDVVSEVSNLLKRLLGESMTLTIKHGRNLGAVRADPGQLEQVIVNLAVNARDAMPMGGTLTLQTFSVDKSEVRRLGSDILPVDDYTALSVTDTGIGISPDILGKIFEPFFTTKEVGKGTGLGLSTVYGIVKQSGGFIFADSTIGEGTSFVIYLPVHRADPRADVAPPPVKEKPGELWGTGNILIVEDEDMVRVIAERALTRQGYTVRTAANGEDALQILSGIGGEGGGEPFDLLISDVVMPAMDGPTMVREARIRFPDMPVLFMSGYAEEQLRRSIDIDRVAFLPKPFSVDQLAAAARDALAGAGAPPK